MRNIWEEEEDSEDEAGDGWPLKTEAANGKFLDKMYVRPYAFQSAIECEEDQDTKFESTTLNSSRWKNFLNTVQDQVNGDGDDEDLASGE